MFYINLNLAIFQQHLRINDDNLAVSYHLRLRVECTFFCNLQSRAQFTQAILVMGLNELLGNPTT
jgi:hypothetical protein